MWLPHSRLKKLSRKKNESYDIIKAVEFIERITKALDDDFVMAKSAMAKLKDVLGSSSHDSIVDDAEKFMDEYDMDQARQILSDLMDRLKSELKSDQKKDSGVKSGKVLVVDDMPENIEVLMELLKTEYKVIGARNGEKALTLARSKLAPDIILLDINMPGMNGFEVCRILKENEETKDIPVIFITAESEVADQAKGFELGAVDYITKPVVPVIVSMRVKTQLEIKKQKDLLARLSTIDGLTQIANRRRFDDILAREWKRCMRNGNRLSLILMDIDHFKQYNDHYGHQAGDDCLRQVARALEKGCIRETDLVARYGGEEFVAVLPDTDLEGALVVAERIRILISLMGIPHEKSSVSSYVSLSQGVVATVPTGSATIHQFVERADECLYQAKKTGRNRAVSSKVSM
jgi:diguanylate cyclase (GGDEF)-like protein